MSYLFEVVVRKGFLGSPATNAVSFAIRHNEPASLCEGWLNIFMVGQNERLI
ncbi:MAG TPA: hypothetical protein VMW38_04320 [Terriglobia bacterium]|nr:hypothetical protein [Terriglobia bacterium]